MIAAGFVILAAMLIVATVDAVESEQGKVLAGFCVLVGYALTIAGLAKWLWSVAP